MRILDFTAIIAFAPPTQPGQEPPPAWVSMVPLILLMVIFYVILIRPQQKKAKEHTALLKRLKTGDKVVTNGGVIGTIVGIKDNSVSIRSADTKMEILKSAVSEVLEQASGAKAEKSSDAKQS